MKAPVQGKRHVRRVGWSVVAKLAAQGGAKPKVNVGLVLGGVVALLLGVGLAGYGLAPAAGFGKVFSAFGGGPPPPDLQQQIQGSIDGLTGRVAWDVAGIVLFIAGVVCLKLAARKPKPKTVEEQVKEEVERRMAAMGLRASAVTGSVAGDVLASSVRPGGPAPVNPNAPAPASAPARASVPASPSRPVPVFAAPLVDVAPHPQPAPPPAPVVVAAPRAPDGRCPTCGRALLGGRYCRVCDR
jgi:hypothetical protein